MKIDITETNGVPVAELISDTIEISHTQDAVDIMMNCLYQGAENIIVHKQHLAPDFFDLKTGVAGDILQKFSTYRARMAIVGDFTNLSSKSLKAFIYESNKAGNIHFVNTREDALRVLARQ